MAWGYMKNVRWLALSHQYELGDSPTTTFMPINWRWTNGWATDRTWLMCAYSRCAKWKKKKNRVFRCGRLTLFPDLYSIQILKYRMEKWERCAFESLQRLHFLICLQFINFWNPGSKMNFAKECCQMEHYWILGSTFTYWILWLESIHFE